MTLVDANVLVYGIDADSPHHRHCSALVGTATDAVAVLLGTEA